MKIEYSGKLTSSENHKGYYLYNEKGQWIGEISPMDENGVEGKKICDFNSSRARTP